MTSPLRDLTRPPSRAALLADVMADAVRPLRKVDAAARIPLADFVRGAWHVVEPGAPLLWNWHIDAVCLHLEAATGGEITRLLINMPPGLMKSLLVAVFWPAWVWTWWPEWRGIFSSYALELAIRDSLRCRDVIASEWYRDTFRPKWSLSGDQNVKSSFQNTRAGFRMSVSVGSKATGFRGNAIIVDDPINATDAYSDEKRESAGRWWFKAMSSRLNDMRSGVRVCVMQRLHDDDLSGRILTRGGYEHLMLPTLYEPERAAPTSIGWTDPRAAEGEVLFPEMQTPAVLDEALVDLGADGFAGQHQQRPAPAGGTMFKADWWRTYDTLPAGGFHEMVQSWDCAFKDEDDSDYVVGQVWGRVGADCYLLDQVRDRLDLPGTIAAVLRMTAKWPKATAKYVEDKANGPAVMQMLRRKVPGLIPVEPQGGKIVRAAAVTPLVEAGNVWLPSAHAAPWIGAFRAEAESFPKGRHDDQVDAMTQALTRLARGGGSGWDAMAGALTDPVGTAAIVGRAKW